MPNPPPATRAVARQVDRREDNGVLIVRATKKLLARLGSTTLQEGEHSIGGGHATTAAALAQRLRRAGATVEVAGPCR
jgi:hypothetical protein